jgi:hypothetical protein
MHQLLSLAKSSKHAAHQITGCHGMTGAGLHAFQEHLASEAPNMTDYNFISFGSAAGAEYRHNPQRFEAPYRLIVSKPEVWAPVLHIINTNLVDNRTSMSYNDKVDPPAVSRLLECPCTPQRKINPAAGTIDGKKPDPKFGCSKDFTNPSCSLSTYVGGWRCCEHGMFLIDTDKECKTPDCAEKFVDEVYMKYTFQYEDATDSTRPMESAACCDVTSSGMGDGNIEHDVIPCPTGTPPDECVFVAESVQPIAYYDFVHRHDLVDLVFAAPHLHWAGISLQLFDHETNKTLCEVHRSASNDGGVMYGNGTEPGNEKGYLTGLMPCTWGGGKAPRFKRNQKLRTRTVYNATSAHTGVMSLWLMQVSAVQESTGVVV